MLAKLKHQNWLWLLLVFLVWHLILLLISVTADSFLTYTPSFPYAHYLLPLYQLPRWLYSWANFDGVHYLTIAENGYFGIGSIQAFFPVWPLLIKAFRFLVNNTIVAGLILNFIFGFFLLFSWQKLLTELFPKANAREIKIRTISLLLFPTSFYFAALYSESLFLLVIIWSFLLARRKKWYGSAILIGIASGLRVVGIFAAIIPIAMYLNQKRNDNWRKKIKMITVLSSFSSIGFVIYSTYLHFRFGDWLYFLHVQSEFGAGRQSELVTYFQSWWRSTKILWFARPINLKYYSYIQDWIAGTLGAWALWKAWISNIPKSLTIFSIAAFIVPTLTGSFSSMPRYILVLPSLLLVWSGLFQQKGWKLYLVASIATIVLAFNTLLFIQGFWVA